MFREGQKEREEVGSLKPAENQLLQGRAQEDGATGRKGEVPATARGAGWALNQSDAGSTVPMRWRGFNGAGKSWERQHGAVYPIKTWKQKVNPSAEAGLLLHLPSAAA